MTARAYAFSFAAIVALALCASALYTGYIDPYWLWRDKPHWSKSEPLFAKMRYVKSLQVVSRQPKILLLGTSRVYRGLDPDSVEGAPGEIYNMGITNLKITEAAAYLEHALRWTPVDKVVMGVDLFMFDKEKVTSPGFDPATGKFSYLFRTAPSALFSFMAIKDSYGAIRDGELAWTRHGFEISQPRSQEKIDEVLREMMWRRGRRNFSESQAAIIGRMATLCREKGVELTLFFSPVHKRHLDGLKKAGKWQDFQAMKQEVTRIANEHRLFLLDFAFESSVTTPPLTSSNRYFIDTSHYSPEVGAMILGRLGFTRKERDQELPEDFGILVSPQKSYEE